MGSYPTVSPLPDLAEASSWRFTFCGTVSGSLQAVVNSQPALQCPDFPLCGTEVLQSDYPTISRAVLSNWFGTGSKYCNGSGWNSYCSSLISARQSCAVIYSRKGVIAVSNYRALACFPQQLYRWPLLIFALILLPTLGFAATQDDRSRTGLWNSYYGHQNIVECSNLGLEGSVLRFEVFSANRQLLFAEDHLLNGSASKHIILNRAELPIDSFGTVVVTNTDTSKDVSASIVCHVMIYRLRVEGTRVAVVYAFSTPVTAGESGRRFGLGNSYNPNGAGLPVPNWLSLVNTSAKPQNFTIRRYSIDGIAQEEFGVETIAPGQRRDVLIGRADIFEANQYEVIPSDAVEPFIAFLTRYQVDPALPPFAVAIDSVLASDTHQVEFASTVLGATNWLELGNMTDRQQEVTVVVRDLLGVAVGTEQVSLAPFAQRHLHVNALLGDNATGSLHIASSLSTGLLARSMHYGRIPDLPFISWIYVSQPGRNQTAGERLAVPANTFLSTANVHRHIEFNGAASTANFQVFNPSASLGDPVLLSFAAFSTVDQVVSDQLGANTLGVSVLRSDDLSTRLAAQGFRFYLRPDGVVEYVASIAAESVPDERTQARLEPLVTGLTQPVALTHAGDGSGRLFIVELTGRILVYKDGALLPTPFLDLSAQLKLEGEHGLFAIAFAPDYATSGVFYVHYSDLNGDTTVSRFRVSAGDADQADAASEQILLTEPQPHIFHNGGSMAFGPDGNLYVALGDGGGPSATGQDLSNLLGAIVRIDVSNTASASYAIPADNPFVANSAARDEIWAYGFRNPWKFSFDRDTGRLFVGDVGQSRLEEIDIVQPGRNYGWITMEGSLCYVPQVGCAMSGLELPVFEYGRSDGVSITGGYVYRGSRFPQFRGKYFYSDFIGSRIWTLTEQLDGSWVRDTAYESPTDIFVSSLGEDEAGELYLVEISGIISRIVADDS